MCYSGKCNYEQDNGDCGLPARIGKSIPDDALCVKVDKFIENAEKAQQKKSDTELAQ